MASKLLYGQLGLEVMHAMPKSDALFSYRDGALGKDHKSNRLRSSQKKERGMGRAEGQQGILWTGFMSQRWCMTKYTERSNTTEPWHPGMDHVAQADLGLYALQLED